MQFLDRFEKHADCVTLHSPADLNDPVRVREAIEALGLEPRGHEIQIEGKQNKTPGAKTTITAQEEDEFRGVIAAMPQEFLDIFTREPYDGQDWVRWLQK